MPTSVVEVQEDLLLAPKKKEVKQEVKMCIDELLTRFWILKENDEQLYYTVRDHEYELKAFFKEHFQFRLLITYEMIKLEKIPVTAYEWMGEKQINGTKTFQKPRDFAFFFKVLAFLESKTHDQQFSLQDVCEYIEMKYPSEEAIIWKEGAGYQNRLTLIRVLKYALKMNLLVMVDQHIEDFAGDSSHDVLFEKTPYGTHYVRQFKEDVSTWRNFDDVEVYLKKENAEFITRKHRYYRRLFLEPVVYHHETTDDEQRYFKQFYEKVENQILRYTDYQFEFYKDCSMLIKEVYTSADTSYPSDSILPTISMSFATYLIEHKNNFHFTTQNEVTLSYEQLNNILTRLKESYSPYWTKAYKTKGVASIREELIRFLINWNFASRISDTSIVVKEGIFRIVGTYQ